MIDLVNFTSDYLVTLGQLLSFSEWRRESQILTEVAKMMAESRLFSLHLSKSVQEREMGNRYNAVINTTSFFHLFILGKVEDVFYLTHIY